MRVSSHQLLDAGIKSIQQHSVEAMKWQQQIASGNKYAKASEGAVAIARGVEIQFDQSKYAMLKANQDFVATRMALADAQLGSIHDALSEMQQIGVQVRDAAIGKIGLQSLAQKARAAYDLLAQQAVAMDTNDDRYLLDTTNVARLDQPKITAIGSDSVAQREDITFAGTFAADDIVELTVNGVRLQYVIPSAPAPYPANSVATDVATRFNAPPENSANATVRATALNGVLSLEAKNPGVPFTAIVNENSAVATASKLEVRANVTEISSATISNETVFHKAGTYFIDNFTTRSIGAGETITEARLQIEGKGPDNTANTYFVGVYEDGILKFPQQPDSFMNLEIAITGDPDSFTELRFEANPVTVHLNPGAKLHKDGAYAVELSKGDQFINGNFEKAGVTYEGTSAFVDGWAATLGSAAGANTAVTAGTNTVEFSPQTRFSSGRSLLLKTTGLAAALEAGAPVGSVAKVTGPVLVSDEPVQLYASDPESARIADMVSFRWAATSTERVRVKVSLVNIDTGVTTEIPVEPATVGPNTNPSWSVVNHTVTQGGRYKLKVESITEDASDDGITAATTSVYIDDVQVVSGAKELTAATLTFDGTAVKTATVANGGLAYDAQTKTTRINFANSADDPSNFYDLSLDLVGDPANLRTTDKINFRVDPRVKQIEIEPGIWVPEGISFREALGNTTPRSRDVLADARAFVESLERAAVSGSLESDFTGKMANLDSATDQVLKYQIRAGVIGAQVDAAKAALEIKATELEAHRSRLLDTDIAEASAGLVRTQTLLEAARSIFARLESSNLFQRLM